MSVRVRVTGEVAQAITPREPRIDKLVGLPVIPLPPHTSIWEIEVPAPSKTDLESSKPRC